MQTPAGSHRGGFQPATLPEASRLLGVSESTVRRLVNAGKLEAERVLRPQGYVWMVEVDEDAAEAAPTSASADAQASSTQGPPHDGLAQEVARLSAHVEDLREQLRAREREVGQLHTLLAQAHQRLLTDGQAAGASAVAPAPETASAPSPQWESRRWWQRLLWG